MSGKTIALVVVVVLFLLLVLAGGGAAFWYFKYGPGAGAPDVGPLAGRALVLPADTAAIGGVNVKAFFASAGYKQISTGEIPGLGKDMSPEEAAKAKKELREGVEKGLKEAEDKTGIRFDRDVERIVIGAWGVSAEKPDGALVALGHFDRAKVTKAVEASAKGEGGKLSTKTVEGVSVQVLSEGDKPTAALAFLDDATLVVGSPAGVETVVTSHAKHLRPLEGDASLLGLVKGLDPASSYWIVLDQPLVARMQKEAGGMTPPTGFPRNLTLAGKFDGGLALTAEMADEQSAKGLAEMAQGGLAMARMQLGQNPEVQKVPGAKELVEGIQVKAEGKKVTLSVPAGGPGLSGALAAVAVPSLLRARLSANEASAIGDVRTVISAEAAFQSAAGGSYGELGCLSEPKGCIQGYDGPVFLDGAFASAAERHGYKQAFHGGAAASAPRSFNAFAYTATPLTVGQTGTRSFCGDSSGVVCFDPSGAEIVPQQGACPAGCLPLDGGPPLQATMTPAVTPPSAEPMRPPTPRPVTPRPTPRPTARPALREVQPSAPPAVTPPRPSAPSAPVRVGGDIREPRKIKNVTPFYPAIAKQARVQGVVILECTISPQGQVSDVKVLRGIPLLDQAAIDAVRQWVYEPTLVNGVPVSVIMTVTVNFKLN